jgi:hypothetical protein
MVRRSRLKSGSRKKKQRMKKIGTLEALYEYVTDPKVRKKAQKILKSRKNEAVYSIFYFSGNRKNLIRFRRNIEDRVHQIAPKAKVLWAKPATGQNDFKVKNATAEELTVIGHLLGTFSVGGFKL